MPLNPSCRPLLLLRASRIRPHQGSLWIGRGYAGEGGGSWWWIGSAVPSCSRRRGCVSCWKSRKYHRSPQHRHSDHQVAFSINQSSDMLGLSNCVHPVQKKRTNSKRNFTEKILPESKSLGKRYMEKRCHLMGCNDSSGKLDRWPMYRAIQRVCNSIVRAQL